MEDYTTVIIRCKGKTLWRHRTAHVVPEKGDIVVIKNKSYRVTGRKLKYSKTVLRSAPYTMRRERLAVTVQVTRE